MDIWSWITELPNSVEWNESDSPVVPKFELASYSGPGEDKDNSSSSTTRSILLKAERTSGSDSEAVVTFTVCLQGFHPFNAHKPLWVSEKCHLSNSSSENHPFLPLLLQLLQEIISHSPTAHDSTCPRSQLQKLKPEPIAWIMDSHTPESLSTFFNLVFTMRLFWLCVCDAPSEAGSLYFHSLLSPALETVSSRLASVLRTFFITVGVDTELCFMRTLGYIIAKWCIIRELGVGLQTLVPSPPCRNPRLSYAAEAHGLWVLKGYGPVMTMKLARSNGQKSQLFPGMDAKESILRYTLAHHQLEAHVQLEYTVGFYDGFIQVNAHVDNIRLHVARLGFKNSDDVDFHFIEEEKHFPSRARVWVGPEIGAAYVAGLSLGRSTENSEGEVEIQKVVKGNFEKSKVSKVKASARSSRRMQTRSWRMDQDAEGNAAIFDVVLFDNVTGQEVGTWKPTGKTGNDPIHGLRGRYVGANRPFTKSGSVVIAGDEYGEGVGWRLSKEMEGSVLKWRIGGEFWVSYWPNSQAKGSSYYETRCVEWCDEVDLPLIHGKIP